MEVPSDRAVANDWKEAAFLGSDLLLDIDGPLKTIIARMYCMD